MSGLASDLRQALRGLIRAPVVTLLVVATLALGIGASTAVFAVVNGVLLRPLPYPDPERLVAVTGDGEDVSGAAFLAWSEGQDVLDLAAYRGASFNSRGHDGPERLTGAIVTRRFFEVMGTPPLLGHLPQSRGVALSERLWRRQFQAAPDVVGRAISLNGESLRVEAVLPASFTFPATAELWVVAQGRVPPHPLRAADDQSLVWSSYYFEVVGRLRAGVELDTARTAVAALGTRLAAAHPGEETVPHLTPLRDMLVGRSRLGLLVLLSAVGLILLIACVNIAHLVLARAVARRQEIAVRVALGAGRLRVVRLFFAESAILATAGAVGGGLVALWSAPLLAALAPRGLSAQAVSLDGRVLLFAGVVAAVVAVAFSLIPALTTFTLAEALRQGGRGATVGPTSRWTRSVLMGLEVALAVVVLASAGLLVRSFAKLQAVDAGFRPEGVLTADLSLPAGRYADGGKRVQFVNGLLERLAARAEVQAAGAVSRLPLSSGNSARDATIVRRGTPEQIHTGLRVATAGYVEALGIPLLRGRALTAADVAEAPRVLLVNEAFARRAWPGEDPLGKTVGITLDQRPAVVAGLIGNVRHNGLDAQPQPEVYVPYAVDPWPTMTVVIRGRIPPQRLAGALREAVSSIDADQALARVSTMEERIAGSLAPRRFTMTLLAIAAATALALALVGIYGMVAHAVAQRRQELGIRLALGAQPRRLVASVVASALRPVGAGVAAGVALALVITRAMSALVFGVATHDAATFVAIALLAAGAAALASWLAARRVTRVNAMDVLRQG